MNPKLGKLKKISDCRMYLHAQSKGFLGIFLHILISALVTVFIRKCRFIRVIHMHDETTILFDTAEMNRTNWYIADEPRAIFPHLLGAMLTYTDKLSRCRKESFNERDTERFCPGTNASVRGKQRFSGCTPLWRSNASVWRRNASILRSNASV